MATLVYNGFSGLSHVKVNEWRTTPEYEVDGLSRALNRHQFSGTALISGTSEAAFDTAYDSAKALLTTPRGNLAITLGSNQHINITAPDDGDGPLAEFQISDPVTPLCAMVTFDITYYQYDLASGASRGDVLAHRWTQEWEIGRDGLMRHRAAGSLRIIATASSTAATAINVGSNPDAYRHIVLPTLPPGFRREKMTFATDETGNRLLYTIEDKEYGRDIPYPATVATGGTRFERTIGSLSQKVFECEMAAPPDVSPKDLLAAAVEVSKTKIKYAGTNRDLIVSIQVTEPDIFNANRIGYRVMARGTATGAGEEGQNISLPNFQLYQNVISAAGLQGYADLPAYAHNAIRSVRRTLFEATDCSASSAIQHVENVPYAQWEQNDAWVSEQVVVAPEAVFDGTDPTVDPGTDTTSENHTQAPYVSYTAVDRIVQSDSGMVTLRANRANSADIAVQIHKPTVYLISEVVLSRVGGSPAPPMRPLPSGSVVKYYDWNVSTGTMDGNNQRVYQGHYKRIAQLAQGIGSTPWYTVPGNPLTGPVQFWPGLSGIVEMPRDLRIDNQTNNTNVFQPVHHPYNFGVPEPLVT